MSPLTPYGSNPYPSTIDFTSEGSSSPELLPIDTSQFQVPDNFIRDSQEYRSERRKMCMDVWTQEQDIALLEGVQNHGRNWKKILEESSNLSQKTKKQCIHQFQNYLDPLLKKHTPTQDEILQIDRLYATYGGKIEKSSIIARVVQRPPLVIKEYLEYLEISQFVPTSMDNEIINWVTKYGNDWVGIFKELILNQEYKKILTKDTDISHRYTLISKTFNTKLNSQDRENISSLLARGISTYSISAFYRIKLAQVHRISGRLKKMPLEKELERREDTSKKKLLDWTEEEDLALKNAVSVHGLSRWKFIVENVPTLSKKEPKHLRKRYDTFINTQKDTELTEDQRREIIHLFHTYSSDTSKKIPLISRRLAIPQFSIMKCLNIPIPQTMKQDPGVVLKEIIALDEAIIKNVARYGENWEKIHQELSDTFDMSGIDADGVKDKFRLLLNSFRRGKIGPSIRQEIYELRKKGVPPKQVCATFKLAENQVNSVYSQESAKRNPKRKKTPEQCIPTTKKVIDRQPKRIARKPLEEIQTVKEKCIITLEQLSILDDEICEHVATHGVQEWALIFKLLSKKYQMQDIVARDLESRFKIILESFENRILSNDEKNEIVQLRKQGKPPRQVAAILKVKPSRISSVYSKYKYKPPKAKSSKVTKKSMKPKTRKKKALSSSKESEKTIKPKKKKKTTPSSSKVSQKPMKPKTRKRKALSSPKEPEKLAKLKNNEKSTPIIAITLTPQKESEAIVLDKLPKQEISQDRLREISDLAALALEDLQNEDSFLLPNLMYETDEQPLTSIGSPVRLSDLDTIGDPLDLTPF